jgi:Flp pilus assembly protein TadD
MFYFFIPRLKLSSIIALLGISAAVAQSDPGRTSNFPLQVNGQVRYAKSRTPAENILVRIESFSGGLISQITTDRTGKFTFTGLSPTQYIVTVHAPGYYDVRENVNLVTAVTGYLNIDLVKDKNSVANADQDKSDLQGLAVLNASIPFEARTEFEKGKILSESKEKSKLAAASDHLEKAIAIYPKFTEAQILLGLVNMALQKWEKAEKSLLTALEADANAMTAYFALGEIYRREKKYPKAVEILLKGVKLNDSSAEGHNLLANVFWEISPTLKDERQKNIALESSWQEVNRALQLKPDLAEAHLLMGNLLLRAGRASDALEHFEQYLNLEPNGEFAKQTKEVVKKISGSTLIEKRKS